MNAAGTGGTPTVTDGRPAAFPSWRYMVGAAVGHGPAEESEYLNPMLSSP
jgi:hypothetical protein